MNNTMKAIVKNAPQRGAESKDVKIPDIKENDVLIKVKATSICGTDLHIYQWNSWSQNRIKVPQIMGHEVAGDIVKVGSGVSDFSIGDYVSCETHIYCGHCYQCLTGHKEICQNLKILGVDRDGAFAEYVAVPYNILWKNPGSLPPEIASIQEPLGNAVDTVLIEDVASKNVLILGAGPIGLLAVGVAKVSGAAQIFVTDLNPYRLAIAKKMGATLTLNPQNDDVEASILEATRGNGPDVVLEMSGSISALHQGLKLLTPGGRISLLGIPDKIADINLSDEVIFKALRIYGITGRKIFSTWHKVSEFLSSGILNVSPVITHVFPYEKVHEAMELMEKGETGKVILLP